eukprot:PhF_6_TR41283/c0_g1_i2/m.62434
MSISVHGTKLYECNGHGECAASADVCQCYQSPSKGYWATAVLVTTPGKPQYCITCDVSHTGANCLTNKNKETCPSRCLHGECDSNGNCVCFGNATFGSWDGASCSKCSASVERGFWSPPGRCNECSSGSYGTNCDTPCPNNKCSGRGQCAKTNGVCLCDNSVASGWWDSSTGCSTCLNSYFGTSCNVYCGASTCGSHGRCNSEGKCTCDASPSSGYWSGDSCSLCSGMRTLESSCVRCRADTYGPDCSVLCVPSTTCNGHGLCNDDGTCACHNNSVLGRYDGSHCDVCQVGYEGKKCLDLTEILSTCRATLKLQLSSVTFTTAFHAIVFEFSSACDQGKRVFGGKVSSKCSDLFDSSTLELFGVDDMVVCEWLSFQSLRVSLSSVTATVTQGTLLAPKNGIFFAYDESYSTRCSVGAMLTPVPVSPPSRTLTPTAVLIGPSNINHCSDLDLSASSS